MHSQVFVFRRLRSWAKGCTRVDLSRLLALLPHLCVFSKRFSSDVCLSLDQFLYHSSTLYFVSFTPLSFLFSDTFWTRRFLSVTTGD